MRDTSGEVKQPAKGEMESEVEIRVKMQRHLSRKLQLYFVIHGFLLTTENYPKHFCNELV